MPAIRFVLRQVHSRPLACFAVSFLLGLVLCQRWPVPVLLCGIALVALLILCAIFRRRRRAFAACLLLAGLLAGMTRMGLALNDIQPVKDRYSVEMTGRVVSEPFTNPTSGRRICHFQLESADGEAEDLRVRLYLRGEAEPLEDIQYGQSLRLTGHIWAADPVTNPGEFDFGAYLNRQGLDAYATAKIEDVTIVGVTHDLRSLLIDGRNAVSRRIDALFPRSAGMMRALVLGDRSMLSDELRQAMSRSGIAHLISISGLHVTVLSALLALLLRRAMPRRYANLLAVALMLPYGAMIGFTAAFSRALVMFAILCFAPIEGRPSDSVTRLCAAMLAWLLIRPLSVGDAGFALSFSASAGILLLMPPLSRLIGLEGLRNRRPEANRVRRLLRGAAIYLLSALCATLVAQLATLPAVVTFFGVQSIVSIPLNLVCVPLCMVGYILGLIALMLSVVWMPLALLLARVPDALLAWMLDIAHVGASIPSAAVHVGRYPFALMAVHWLVIVAASDLSKLRFSLRRFFPIALVGVAAFASLLVFVRSWPFSVTFLDAGQADCAVVRSRGHTLVIDTGDTYTPVADYLNATCLRVDSVLLTHPHQDHAGGLSDLLDSFKPDTIYVPKGWFEVENVAPAVTEGIEKATALGVEIVELSAGDLLQISPAAQLEVYSPRDDSSPETVNDMSLMTLITCEGQAALFTGDLSAEGEPETVPNADILKVAHHGSKKATSERFLAASTPEIAVIPVGENNYGHPGEETLEKLADVGATVYEARRTGAITLTWWGGAWRVETYLEASNEVE